MAVVFELWAECATVADCSALVAHFDKLQMNLLTGRAISWNASITTSLPTAMLVSAPGFGGMCRLDDVLETTEAGIRLFHHLSIGPAFRFARVGWEAGCVPMADLIQWVASIGSGKCHLEVDCVMDNALYSAVGSPEFCYPFREGYQWTRYHGQTYSPLQATDQPALNKLCRSLFPDFFKY